jgi:tripartite-type tricarboxylate transporter receptor subunit TctC
MFMTTPFATAASTGDKLPYDAPKDFAPIGQVGATPLVVVVSKDSACEILRELPDAARARPNSINDGSRGIGSMSHYGMATSRQSREHEDR